MNSIQLFCDWLSATLGEVTRFAVPCILSVFALFGFAHTISLFNHLRFARRRFSLTSDWGKPSGRAPRLSAEDRQAIGRLIQDVSNPANKR